MEVSMELYHIVRLASVDALTTTSMCLRHELQFKLLGGGGSAELHREFCLFVMFSQTRRTSQHVWEIRSHIWCLYTSGLLYQTTSRIRLCPISFVSMVLVIYQQQHGERQPRCRQAQLFASFMHLILLKLCLCIFASAQEPSTLTTAVT